MKKREKNEKKNEGWMSVEQLLLVVRGEKNKEKRKE
jgi:hypothetical protein